MRLQGLDLCEEDLAQPFTPPTVQVMTIISQKNSKPPLELYDKFLFLNAQPVLIFKHSIAIKRPASDFLTAHQHSQQCLYSYTSSSGIVDARTVIRRDVTQGGFPRQGPTTLCWPCHSSLIWPPQRYNSNFGEGGCRNCGLVQMDSNFFKQFPSTRSLPAADNLRSNEFNFVFAFLCRQLQEKYKFQMEGI